MTIIGASSPGTEDFSHQSNPEDRLCQVDTRYGIEIAPLSLRVGMEEFKCLTCHTLADLVHSRFCLSI